MKRIVLTEFREMLEEYPNSPADDNTKMEACIGVHVICGGFVDLKPVSDTHSAIICRNCHLRLVIPNSIQTYGDLRWHFRKFNS